MDRTIFDAFTKKNAMGYINTKEYTPRAFPIFFPVKQTAFLDYETIIGSDNRAVAADVIQYDTKAPRKTRRVLGKIKGEIPQISMAKELTGKDFNKIDQLNAFIAAGNDNAQSELLDIVYNDVDATIEGCYARAEWLCMQAASKFEIALTSSNNNGIITEDNIDFQLPDANKRVIKTATSNRAWSVADVATMTPLADIDVIVETFRSSGIRFSHILMDRSVFNMVKKSTEVITALNNYSGAVSIPTLTQINEYLVGQGDPIIVVVDSYVEIEDEAGDKTTTNCWDTTYTTFIPQLELGNLLSGPIAEYNHLQNSDATLVKNADGIVVMKWSGKEPLLETTKGIWNAFPTFPSVDKCVRLKHGSVAADGLDD